MRRHGRLREILRRLSDKDRFVFGLATLYDPPTAGEVGERLDREEAEDPRKAIPGDSTDRGDGLRSQHPDSCPCADR